MDHGISDIMEFIEVTYSVLVCDDDPGFAKESVQDINAVAPEDYRVHTEPNKAVHDATREILRRRGVARKEYERIKEGKAVGDGNAQTERLSLPRGTGETNSWNGGHCLFDEIDILIIDYDLIHIGDDNTEYTGESLARLARMFSSCSVVVVLNQFDQVDFDLSLRGHLASHADLNIDVRRLATPGLWRNPPWEGYRPWSWQTLSQAVETQRARERAMREALDRPIVEIFGMQRADVSRLSDSAFGFIAPNAADFEALRRQTLRSFLSTTANGLDSNTLLETDLSAAVRFAAARIGKWLEREVLGPQDILIDLPHLLQRFPFLLGKEVSNVNAWNEAVHRPDLMKQVIDDSYWFQPAECLSRRAVWCQRLEADENIKDERAIFDYSSAPSIAFMEDCSVFADMAEGKEFRAGFHNAFDRRFVKRLDDVRYGPQRRFAFGK